MSPLTYLCVCSVAQSCPALCKPMDCSLPGSSVHVIFQARILERVAMPFSVDLRPRDQTHILSPVSLTLQADSLLLRHWGNPCDLFNNCILIEKDAALFLEQLRFDPPQTLCKASLCPSIIICSVRLSQSANRCLLRMYSFSPLTSIGRIKGRIMPFLTSQEKDNKV